MDKIKQKLITIDGSSGVGKGTASRAIACSLGWRWLDSGSLYRLVAWNANNNQTDLNDVASLVKIASTLDFQFQAENPCSDPEILLNGKIVTNKLRTESCGKMASQISSIPALRAALLQRQRDFLTSEGLVADGRDMGTVVFPSALLKIFLTATAEVRANRRYKQLLEQGINVNMSDLLQELIARDGRDMGRAVAPLKPAEDAIQIDTSELNATQVQEIILKHAKDIWG